MARDYENGKLLYHFTALNNLKNIIEHGLLSRRAINNFIDVANPDILKNRERFNLDSMVPFHFFSDNPFDGRVWIDNPTKDFIYLTVQRAHAKASDWKISPKHPLNGVFTLLDYNDGID
ncbi:DUF4433 domain-containing protein, partial [Aliivibrio salmonicida]